MKTLTKYIIPLKLKDGTCVLFNTRNQALVKVQANEYEVIRHIAHNKNLNNVINNIRPELVKILIEQKFIVTEDDDKDYLANEILRNKIMSFASDTLSLTIAPTSDCNFACPYCYEKHKSQCSMSDEVIERLVSYVKDYQPCKKFKVTWYGGEPLLAFDVIKKVSEKLIAIQDKEWVGHSIVTNASLITDEVIQYFKQYKLRSIQISLDGIKEHHDVTRRYKYNKSGSFDVIINNIERLLQNLPNTDVVVRVNIDKNNIDDYGKIAQFFADRFGEQLTHLRIYPGYIRVEDEERGCWNCNSILNQDKYLFFDKMADAYGVPVNWMPQRAAKGCGATSLHSYIIGPKGDMYKCWNDFGDKACCIGNVADDQLKGNTRLMMRYLAIGTGLDTPECCECKLLPVCSTGCPWERLSNVYDNKHFDLCTMAKNEEILARCMDGFLAGKKI